VGTRLPRTSVMEDKGEKKEPLVLKQHRGRRV
jgi:hypothetical protein